MKHSSLPNTATFATMLFGNSFRNNATENRWSAAVPQSQRDCSIKPGVARHELPRVTAQKTFPTLTGLHRRFARMDSTLSGLLRSGPASPKVARASQPWAGGWNPFGIRQKNVRRALTLIAALMFLAAITLTMAETIGATTNRIAQAIEIPGVHNAFRVTEKIFSGSQPEGDAAFAALAKLGVKTLISVDGSKPDVEAAHQHGLRYIHLPYGYDGVPTNRVAELATAATSGVGPFFVHCHHGKHRGPAAVAVMCLASDGWTADRAVEWMRAAGTADDYPGLYRAAREFKAPTATQLAAVKELPEVAKSSSLVDAMVAMDAHFEALKRSQQAGWKTAPGHADISPEHEATLLLEQLQEIPRTIDLSDRPEDFRKTLAATTVSVVSLSSLLKDSTRQTELDSAFKQIGPNCSACHKKHRNE
jgi:hypothetical protein